MCIYTIRGKQRGVVRDFGGVSQIRFFLANIRKQYYGLSQESVTTFTQLTLMITQLLQITQFLL